VKKAAPWVLAGLAAAAMVVGIVLQSRHPPEQPAKALESFTLDQVKGEIALVNVWATWCAPCRRELPALLDIADAYGPKGVHFVAVNADQGGRSQVEAFVRGQPPTLMAHLAYPSDGFMDAIGLQVLPTTLIVDKQGQVVKRFRGAIHADEVKAALDKVLAGTRTP
jgi:thiol-disulfide isomerase/thioredoxin